jgi:methionyl-tRNA synthetase
MASPFVPEAAEKAASFFGLTLKPGSTNSIDWVVLGKQTGLTEVLRSEVLFAKHEEGRVRELREKYAGSQADRKKSEDEKPKIDDKKVSLTDAFKAIDLRVAKIVKVERHPEADKLYVETLEIAGEERVIVSGLVPFYSEAELLGKHIIVAYNLKKAKLRGVESRGMLLAASFTDAAGTETVEVLDAGDTETGTQVKLQGINDSEPIVKVEKNVSIDTFLAVPILVKDGVVVVDGHALTLAGKPVKTGRVTNGEVH